MALPPGTVMGGDYTILGPLAQGGMGSVYVAEQISTGRRRALKLMHPELARDVRSVERFAQEARVGARIGSEHVVEVVGAGIDPAHGLPWLAMEMLEGGDLASVVSSRGALPVAEVLEILEQACDAIAKAHAQGVVHRDLKPENLFIAVSHRRGVPFTVKVLDFGIAKLLSECQSAATATSTIGSPLWMAPEQADRKGKLGPPTDVWALGLITFYMLTGRMYWHAANDAEIGITALLKEVLLDEIVPASQRARDIGCAVTLPAAFDAWFARCVTRTAAERFANGAELMSAARAVLGGTAPLDASSPSSSGAAWAVTSGAQASHAGAMVASQPHAPTTLPRTELMGATPAPVVSHVGSGTVAAPLAPHPSLPSGPIAYSAPVVAPAPSRSGATTALVLGGVVVLAVAALLGGTALLFADRAESPRSAVGPPPVPAVAPPAPVVASPPAVVAPSPTPPSVASVPATVPVAPAPTPPAVAPPSVPPSVPTTATSGVVTSGTAVVPIAMPDDDDDASPTPTGAAPFVWNDGSSQSFSGSWSAPGHRYRFVLTLHRNGGSVSGQFNWRRVGDPPSGGTEWVRGSYDPSSGRLLINGYRIAGQVGRDQYRLHVGPNGRISGTSRTNAGTWAGRLSGRARAPR